MTDQLSETYSARELDAVAWEERSVEDNAYRFSRRTGRNSRVLKYHLSCGINKGIFVSKSLLRV